MTRVLIPRTIEEAVSALTGVESLLTAKEWERAAIVWAFTEIGAAGRPPKSGGKSSDSITAFAALGIAGLRTRDTVRFHRKQWERAIEAGYEEARPGRRVDLPEDLDWQDHDDESRKTRYVARNEGAVARSIDREELDAEVLAQNLSPLAAEAVAARIIEDRPEVARALVEGDTGRAIAKAQLAQQREETAITDRRTREHAPGLAETSEFMEALGLMEQGRSRLRHALQILQGLPPLGEEPRKMIRQECDVLDAAVLYLREMAKARRAASLADEVEEFLHAQH